jgi:hypothetical protein
MLLIGPSRGTSMTTGCVLTCAPVVRMIDADLAFRLALKVRNGAHPDDRHPLRAMLEVRKHARTKLADGTFLTSPTARPLCAVQAVDERRKGKV